MIAALLDQAEHHQPLPRDLLAGLRNEHVRVLHLLAAERLHRQVPTRELALQCWLALDAELYRRRCRPTWPQQLLGAVWSGPAR